jgi:predicted peroxiredoxin
MARLLVHICAAPQDPTRLALGLLVARTARAKGHDVDVFVAGDAVHLLRDETRDSVLGLGTGNAGEHWAELQRTGARLFASGNSAKARDIAPVEGVELAPPDRLVELIMSADRVVSY